MNQDIFNFTEAIQNSWSNFTHLLPSMLMAILVFAAGTYAIKILVQSATVFLEKKSKSSLASDFLINIISFILHLILLVLCLSILGWGNISSKILAGAGLTTIIVGFALKDIGENFLAGMILAFKRPFNIGDIIEIDSIKGEVVRMTLRETLVKTADGKDVFVPNAMIFKSPIKNLTLDNRLRGDFTVTIGFREDIDDLIKNITDTVNTFRRVIDLPQAFTNIVNLGNNTIELQIYFWYETNDPRSKHDKLKSDIMSKVYKLLLDKGVWVASPMK